jgi:hypothetical protein
MTIMPLTERQSSFRRPDRCMGYVEPANHGGSGGRTVDRCIEADSIAYAKGTLRLQPPTSVLYLPSDARTVWWFAGSSFNDPGMVAALESS